MPKTTTATDATLVRNWLNDRYETRSCTLVGRAASAIYVMLKALQRPGSGVVVPAITCPAAVYPVVLAGYRPLFVDVSLDDFNVDAAIVDGAVGGDEVAAVLAIHSFGNWLDLEPLDRWCRSRDAVLIEDVCQIMGSGHEGRAGHAVVASFGHSKPIDCGDGGALLLRDDRFAEAVAREALALPQRPPHHEALTAEYRATYYRSRDRARELDPNGRSGFADLSATYRDLHLYDGGVISWTAVRNGLARIHSIAGGRRKKAAIYRDAFSGLALRMTRPDSRDMPWRFTFALEDGALQQKLTDALRARGTEVSNWYPSLSLDWSEPAGRCPRAAWFESRVLNLWVDESVTEADVEETASFVVRFMTDPTHTARPR